ncbi:hypothetical protein [Ilumatobacter sp.]|uniref:hypothetical protein n=1 Tax=Ilumatobacter sp. TaxID=1967498 RepID=UPI003B51852E
MFVKGISDRIIVKSVAHLMAVGLDRCGVSIVALNGSGGFKAGIRLFGPAGLGVRILGLVDEKEQSDPAVALGVSTTDLLANDILTCYEDLEDEYVTSLGVADTVAVLIGSGLFSEAGLVAATGAMDAPSIDCTSLIDFARRNKVEAAGALARGMSKDQAVKLTTVVELINRATS